MRDRLLRAAERLPGWWRMRYLVLPGIAAVHRKRLDGVTFVGVTGSGGKTTTKILTTAVLATAGRIRPWAGTMNNLDHIMSVVVATKPNDDFCVIEFSAGRPGSLDRALALVRPRIGVVTSIGTDHLKNFHSVDAIVEEKVKVITCLPPDGIAVLNADDPRVAAMADRFPGRIITFGRAEGAMLRAENVRAAWPERLSFTAVHEGSAVEVRSQLCGAHWTPAILAALAVGIAAGIPLERAAEAIAGVEPYPSRMYPVTSPGGVTFIVDDWKSPLWTVPSVLDFLAAARAPRKIAVIGTLSDYGGNAGAVYVRTARAALEVADHVAFVGPMATHALRAKRPETADRLHAFSTIKAAAEFLETLLIPGDLVAVKGSTNADHLGRIAHQWVAPITCWSMTCRKNMPCSSCDELRAGVRAGAAGRAGAPPPADTAGPAGGARFRDLAGPFEVVVGIGNPGDRYRDTPHNVGFAVLDAMAERLGLAWAAHDDIVVAHTRLEGRTLLLVKSQKHVNHTGACLKRLADELGFAPQDCILVQDDIHLPLGKLRSRARGSDGGHKGVGSVLVAFQTDDIRRLKIGVAPAAPPESMPAYLLAPFAAEAAAVMDSAVGAAVDRLLSTLRRA